MKVVGNKILVEQIKTKAVSDGGIVLPTDSIMALPYGTVRQIGPGVREIKVGEVVLFDPISARPLAIKEDHVLIEPDDILAVLDEGEY